MIAPCLASAQLLTGCIAGPENGTPPRQIGAAADITPFDGSSAVSEIPPNILDIAAPAALVDAEGDLARVEDGKDLGGGKERDASIPPDTLRDGSVPNDGPNSQVDAQIDHPAPQELGVPDAAADLFFDPAALIEPCSVVDPPDVVEPEFAAVFGLTAVAPGYLWSVVDADGDGVSEVFAIISEGRDVPLNRLVGAGYSFRGERVDSAWDTDFAPLDFGDIDLDEVRDVVGIAWVPAPPDDVALAASLQVRRLDQGTSLTNATVLATIRPGETPEWLNFYQAWMRDVDGDGRLEVIDAVPAEIRELQQGRLVRTSVDDNPAEHDFIYGQFGSIAVDDLDRDGMIDVVALERLPPELGGLAVARVAEIEPDGRFRRRFHEVIPTLNLDLVATGTFSGNGRRGFLRGGSEFVGCYSFGIYDCVADDTYQRTWTRSVFLPGNLALANADAGDTNADGRDEFVINTGTGLWLYESDGSGGFRLIFELMYEDCMLECQGTVALRDVTGDGRADLIVGRGPANAEGWIPADGIQIYERTR